MCSGMSKPMGLLGVCMIMFGAMNFYIASNMFGERGVEARRKIGNFLGEEKVAARDQTSDGGSSSGGGSSNSGSSSS